MMIKKRLSLSLVILSAIVLLASQGFAAPQSPYPAATGTSAAKNKQAWEERWNQVVLEGKKEKTVTIYMAPSPDFQRAITQAFKQKYDIDLNFIVGRGAALAEKIFAERRAGLYLGDVVIQGNTVQLLIFKPADVLQKLEPYLILPDAANPKVWLGEKLPFLDKDRTIMYFFAGLRNYVARNTELVNEAELKSLNDLLNPKWKGQIVLFDPRIPGSGSGWFSLVYGLLGPEKGAQYMRQFIKQEPVISRDDRVIVEGLARGKYKVAVGFVEGLFNQFKRNGAPIDMVRTAEGNFLAPSMGDVSILKNAPHPNASTVFFNWLLTREGQTTAAKSAGTPSARNDVPLTGIEPSCVLPPGEKFYLESEEDVLAKNELMARAKEIFGPLMK